MEQVSGELGKNERRALPERGDLVKAASWVATEAEDHDCEHGVEP